MDFSNISIPKTMNLLVSFIDIEGFVGISKNQNDLISLFELLNGWAKIIINEVENANGRVIKFIGDACLLVFGQEEVDVGVKTLFSIKRKTEEYLLGNGYKKKMKITAHIGEVVIGEYGSGNNKAVDIFGDTVNIASSLEIRSHHGQLIVSPQVFRKLTSSTRKLLHKYTPPIIYIAE